MEQRGHGAGQGDGVVALLLPGARLVGRGEGVATQRKHRGLVHAGTPRTRPDGTRAVGATPSVVCMIEDKALKIVHAGMTGTIG
jgi:hypothetical protein